MRRLNLSCMLLLLLGSSAHAGDLYVTTSGVSNTCTIADPCGSIQKAVIAAASGDTIHVAAGTYVENIKLGGPMADNSLKSGLTITGAGAGETIVVSAGPSTQRPGGTSADIVFDVWYANTVIEKLTIKHPKGPVIARDIGVFVGPPAANTILRKTKVVRKRSGEVFVGIAPGSRGILVFRAKGTVITRNKFKGGYEDHIHMPTSKSTITHNDVKDAVRLGIVIIQESVDSDNTGNIISKNEVEGSGSDGIQIQGDNNVVTENEVEENGGAAIKLCGETDNDDTAGDGDCVNPFDKWAHATGNTVTKNEFEENGTNSVVNNGSNNTVNSNKVDD